jgi:hypothetical protein
MSAARVRELPEAASAGPRRQAGRDAATTRPGRPTGPGAGPRRAGAAVAGLARRLRGLPGSVDVRRLAGPAAVFFLWPPRPGRRAAGPAPGADTGGNGRYQGRTKPRTAARTGDYQDGRTAS